MSAKNIQEFHPINIRTSSLEDMKADIARNLMAIEKTLLDILKALEQK